MSAERAPHTNKRVRLGTTPPSPLQEALAQKLRESEQQLRAVQQQREAAEQEVQHLTHVQVCVCVCVRRHARALAP